MYAITGDSIKAKELLNKTIEENPSTSFNLIAKTLVALKDYKNAILYLEKAYNDREIFMYFIAVDPAFNPLKNQPEFKTLLKKMGLR